MRREAGQDQQRGGGRCSTHKRRIILSLQRERQAQYMRCLAVCQDELVIRMLDQILVPSIEVDFLVDSRALARKLQDAKLPVTEGDIRRTDTYIKADISPQTIVIIEDTGKRNLPRVIESIRNAGGLLIYVLGVGSADREKRAQTIRAQF